MIGTGRVLVVLAPLLVLALALLAQGAVLAKTFTCAGNPCAGTRRPAVSPAPLSGARDGWWAAGRDRPDVGRRREPARGGGRAARHGAQPMP